MVPTYEIILDDDDGASILVRDNLNGTAMLDADPMHGDVDPWSHERIREMGRNLMAIADAIERNDKGPKGGED